MRSGTPKPVHKAQRVRADGRVLMACQVARGTVTPAPRAWKWAFAPGTEAAITCAACRTAMEAQG